MSKQVLTKAGDSLEDCAGCGVWTRDKDELEEFTGEDGSTYLLCVDCSQLREWELEQI